MRWIPLLAVFLIGCPSDKAETTDTGLPPTGGTPPTMPTTTTPSTPTGTTGSHPTQATLDCPDCAEADRQPASLAAQDCEFRPLVYVCVPMTRAGDWPILNVGCEAPGTNASDDQYTAIYTLPSPPIDPLDAAWIQLEYAGLNTTICDDACDTPKAQWTLDVGVQDATSSEDFHAGQCSAGQHDDGGIVGVVDPLTVCPLVDHTGDLTQIQVDVSPAVHVDCAGADPSCGVWWAAFGRFQLLREPVFCYVESP